MARQTRRKSTRRKQSRRSSKRSTGGGWSLNPSTFVSAGNLVNSPYTGAGKDCAGSVVRPGFISSHSGSGVPGMSGGKRKQRSRRSRGGYQLAIAPITVSAPGIPAHAMPAAAPQAPQKGGRYESNPGALLNNGSDIGMSSYSSAGSIACERGSTNSLNMHGGAQIANTVAVGAADSMRYNAPTAGYGHGFQTFPGTSAVGGLMLNTPYDARAYNPACSKTGGGSVADGAASYSALQAGQMTGRGDFDGSKGLLPMKFGGKRRTHRRKHRKHSRK